MLLVVEVFMEWIYKTGGVLSKTPCRPPKFFLEKGMKSLNKRSVKKWKRKL